MSEPQADIVLVSIGNTRARIAAAIGSTLEPSRVVDCAEAGGLTHGVLEVVDRYQAPRVLVGSVNEPAARSLEDAAAGTPGLELIRLGRDLPIPVPHTLSDASTVGHDRLLSALGAFARSQQACIVVDAGTAVTVDFIDGEGTFHGGAIAPGLRMMLDALHKGTAALPRAPLAPEHLHRAPEPPFGKNTIEAINLGVTASVIGLVHHLIDRYAAFYEAYPRVVATGGDAPFLFENDELVESIVPDLPLIGMLTAWELAS